MEIENKIFNGQTFAVVLNKDGNEIYSNSITDILLVEILNKLEELRCGIIDVENSVLEGNGDR